VATTGQTKVDVDQAIEDFDLNSVQASEHAAEAQRIETVARYLLGSWPAMTLEQYAQGQEGHPENFCRWIERQTPEMGSIRGGSARKLIIYKHRDKPGWYFPAVYANEQEAWQSVRAAFVEAFALAQVSKWPEIDQIEALQRGPALLAKTLWAYFPDELLPITASDHLRHFLRVFGRDDVAADQAVRTVQLNRTLLDELRTRPKLATAPTKVLERLLYMRFSPFEGRLVKISPGKDARFWSECETGGYICVGWDEVGDLRQYESKDAFLAAFRAAFGSTYSTEATLHQKADEVWLLLDLAVGERVVANRGTKTVLAVGTIEPPGYFWNEERVEYKHCLRVSWDEAYAKEITAQPYWAFKTVYPLPSKVANLILGEEKTDGNGKPEPLPDESEVFDRIAAALDRKNQVILYGPPGTGKTWHANTFARQWLRGRNGELPEVTVVEGVGAEGVGRAWFVSTSPSEWHWDEAFEKGEQLFRRGRVASNYDEVEVGDLVFGYTATPAKKLETLARIGRIETTEDGQRTFVLTQLERVKDGPTWDELQADPYLEESQPIRNRMQGTLFRLRTDEAERLIALIAERDPEAVEFASSSSVGAAAPTDSLAQTLEWVTFHPSYSYEDFVEGFRPSLRDDQATLRLEDGIFKSVCQRAIKNPNVTFLLIIDEINRANLTKVFGELITLIEKDKRNASTESDGFAVLLPYSKERFVVPSNVFIIGTMNTADRSIKLLDTAFRRRFAFIELMPNPDLLTSEVGGLRIDNLLRALNARVAKEAGREKQIGHSFFLKDGQPITDEAEFALIFRDEIVPLLQEYAGDDFDELADYLGPKLVDVGALEFNEEALADSSQLLEALEEHLLGATPSP
jgi:5-methylcytosine-specific restriction enzyme B